MSMYYICVGLHLLALSFWLGHMFVWVLVAGVGSWLTYIDWRTKLLPLVIVGPTYVATVLLVGLGALLLHDVHVFTRALVANIVVYVIFRVTSTIVAASGSSAMRDSRATRSSRPPGSSGTCSHRCRRARWIR